MKLIKVKGNPILIFKNLNDEALSNLALSTELEEKGGVIITNKEPDFIISTEHEVTLVE